MNLQERRARCRIAYAGSPWTNRDAALVARAESWTQAQVMQGSTPVLSSDDLPFQVGGEYLNIW
jgi:hypothetical protein